MTITEILQDIRSGLVDGAYWIREHTLDILLVLMVVLFGISAFAYAMAALASLR